MKQRSQLDDSITKTLAIYEGWETVSIEPVTFRHPGRDGMKRLPDFHYIDDWNELHRVIEKLLNRMLYSGCRPEVYVWWKHRITGNLFEHNDILRAANSIAEAVIDVQKEPEDRIRIPVLSSLSLTGLEAYSSKEYLLRTPAIQLSKHIMPHLSLRYITAKKLYENILPNEFKNGLEQIIKECNANISNILGL